MSPTLYHKGAAYDSSYLEKAKVSEVVDSVKPAPCARTSTYPRDQDEVVVLSNIVKDE